MHVLCYICDQKQCADVQIQRVLFIRAIQTNCLKEILARSVAVKPVIMARLLTVRFRPI